MIIRDFIPSDLDDVLRIDYATFPDPYPVDIFIKLYEAGAGFLVADVSDKVVGYVLFWLKDKIGHIIVIAVDPKYRGINIGSILLQKALWVFRQNGIRDVKLEVKKSNIRAIKFYQNKGFVEIDREENYYDDGETAIIMLYSRE